MKWEDLLPSPPPYLPMPRFLKRKLGYEDPPILLYDAELEKMGKRTKGEIMRKGYSKGLAETAVEWAEDYAKGISEFIDGTPEEREAAYRGAFGIGLGKCQRWVERFTKAYLKKK